ncbi:COPII subunit [Didymosphaeria variabile]|uniref:COPII subunit n=1 Tax=Didymosphaeria variabile TaxID=1932322 RepID=A0A9W8XBM9_9PLEO|nr:COPII subunit [Didymosphaeria variabile]KAJ4346510.1 COPII subunit [Didymosphaeria variabile]
MAPPRKNRYAGVAYEQGANVPANAGPPGAPAGLPPQGPQGDFQAQYGFPSAQSPSYGAPQYPVAPQDPNALGQQFQGMSLGGQPQQLPPQVPQQVQQNQLLPSDLIAALQCKVPKAFLIKFQPIPLPANLAATPSPHANCPAPYIRSTLASVPTTHSLLKKSKLPFSLIVQPYTSLHEDEAPIPVIDDQVGDLPRMLSRLSREEN